MLDWTPYYRLYARWRRARLAAIDPGETQRRTLLGLVEAARETRFGHDHGFEGIRSVADFRARVPLRRYEDFWADYWRAPFPVLRDCTWPGAIPYLAVTSGTTTGKTKYIPVSPPMVAANRRAAADILVHHLANRPASRLLGGLTFMLGGSTALEPLGPGVEAGDLSGIAAREVPAWARPRTFPPPEYEAIRDWEEKIARLVPLARARDIRAVTGTPSWMLVFFERLLDALGDDDRRLARAFPNLELVIHGGVGFPPYRGLFAELMAGGHAETREVYAASEGFVAVADRGDGEGLRLVLDNGLFFEFVPAEALDDPDPPRLGIGDVETGVNYAVVMTTNAGLWAFVVGDTVRFVDLDPPRILVTGRTAYTLSAFGEHLIAEEIEDAVAAAAEAIGAGVADFAVGAVYPSRDDALGGHLFVVEFAGGRPEPARLEVFTATLDAALAETNDDYAAHRAGGTGMRAPGVLAVAPGTFAAWMKARGQLGGQHKVPRIVADDDLFAGLRTFVGER